MRIVLTSAALVAVIFGVASYSASGESNPLSHVFGTFGFASGDSFESDAELRKLRDEIHRAFDGTKDSDADAADASSHGSDGIMIGISGPLEERYIGSSETLCRDLFTQDGEDYDDEEYDDYEDEEYEDEEDDEGDIFLRAQTSTRERAKKAKRKKTKPKKKAGTGTGTTTKKKRGRGKGGRGKGAGYLPKHSKSSKGGGGGGYLPKYSKSSKSSSSKGSKGSEGSYKSSKGGGKGYPTGRRKKRTGRNKKNRARGKTQRTSIFDPETTSRRLALFGKSGTSSPGRSLYDNNRDGSLPFVDGSATVFRRDATPLNVVEAFFPTALSESNGLFGYYWRPSDNAKVAQCAYPVDGYTLCRGSSAVDQDMVADRCSKMIDCHDDRVKLPSTITNMDPFMCNEEEPFHVNAPAQKMNGLLRTSESTSHQETTNPSCIQQMLDKKMKTPEYRSFHMNVPWAPSTMKDSIADMSYTEVVINREQDVYSGSDASDAEVPRAAGWVWVHAGPQLWTVEQLSRNSNDTDEEATNIRNLLCGLYHWDSEMWQNTGRGLEQPQYLVQMVSSYGYASDKKTEEIFDVLDLAKLCQ